MISAKRRAPLALGCMPSESILSASLAKSVCRSMIWMPFALATSRCMGMMPLTMMESLMFQVDLMAGMGVQR